MRQSTIQNPLLTGVMLLVALVATETVVWGQIKAGKPGNPPPPATLPGILFYPGTGESFAIRPDGTGLTSVLGFQPGFYRQGGNPFYDRWHLGLEITGYYVEARDFSGNVTGPWPHYDLFAYRGTLANAKVQLTDLYGIMRLTNGPEGFSAFRENDPSTHFANVYGRDIRSSFFESGVPGSGDYYSYYDVQLSPDRNILVPISAEIIEAAWQTGTSIAYRPSTPTDLDPKLLPATITGEYSWRSNGDVVFAGATKVIAVNPATPDIQQVIFDAQTMGEPSKMGAQFGNNVSAISPDGTMLAVRNYYRGEARGGIWVLSLNGSFPPKQIASDSSKTKYEYTVWSPDSRYVATLKSTYSGTKQTGVSVQAIPLDGSTMQTLPTVWLQGTNWVSANTAP